MPKVFIAPKINQGFPRAAACASPAGTPEHALLLARDSLLAARRSGYAGLSELPAIGNPAAENLLLELLADEARRESAAPWMPLPIFPALSEERLPGPAIKSAGAAFAEFERLLLDRRAACGANAKTPRI